MRPQDIIIGILAGLVIVVACWFVLALVPEEPVSACGTDCVMRAAEGK